MATVKATGLGVRYLFDASRRVITPGKAKLLRRVTETWGLREVDATITAGEGVALIGASGSGKTTLLRVIGGVLPVDAGELEVEGRIGSLLSIDAGLTPTLTGRENAILLGVLAGLSRPDAIDATDDLAVRSRLEEAFERPASSYSQGMRARLALAAADEVDPQILLLDEVHEALDHDFRAALALDAKQRIDAGGIVVAAGHDHEMLGRLCSRAIWLEQGRLIEDGPFEQVRAAYRQAHGA